MDGGRFSESGAGEHAEIAFSRSGKPRLFELDPAQILRHRCFSDELTRKLYSVSGGIYGCFTVTLLILLSILGSFALS